MLRCRINVRSNYLRNTQTFELDLMCSHLYALIVRRRLVSSSPVALLYASKCDERRLHGTAMNPTTR